MRKLIARTVAIAAVLAAAFATPALAQGGPTGHDNGRHCGTTRGHHKGWAHHPKTHLTGRGCPAHPSQAKNTSTDQTTTTTGSSTDTQTQSGQRDDNGQGDDQQGTAGDDDQNQQAADTDTDDSGQQGDDDAQDQQDS